MTKPLAKTSKQAMALGRQNVKAAGIQVFFEPWVGDSTDLAPVVQKVVSAIHWIKHYPSDSAIGFPNTCSLDNDLSGG